MFPPRHREFAALHGGFTLLELLLVVLILSATALLAVSSLEGAQEQTRFEETRARWGLAREAIVGGRRSGPGAAEGSFVDDIGRLPTSVLELIEPLELPAWDFDPMTGLGAGWRGPYVPVRLEGNYPEPFPVAPTLAGRPRRTFRDGWNLHFDEQVASAHAWQGWRAPVSPMEPGEFVLQSFGSDGVLGGSGFGAEFPPNAPDLPPSAPGFGPPPLVVPGDWLLDLRGASVLVTFVDFPDAFAERRVRLRCLYPQDGSYAWPSPKDWPSEGERDATPWLSESQLLSAPESGDQLDLLFEFIAPGNIPKQIPIGRRAFQVVLDEDLGGQAGEPMGLAQRPVPVQLEARTGPPFLSITWRVSP